MNRREQRYFKVFWVGTLIALARLAALIFGVALESDGNG